MNRTRSLQEGPVHRHSAVTPMDLNFLLQVGLIKQLNDVLNIFKKIKIDTVALSFQ